MTFTRIFYWIAAFCLPMRNNVKYLELNLVWDTVMYVIHVVIVPSCVLLQQFPSRSPLHWGFWGCDPCWLSFCPLGLTLKWMLDTVLTPWRPQSIPNSSWELWWCFVYAVWIPAFGGSFTQGHWTGTRSWSSCVSAPVRSRCSMWWARTRPSWQWNMLAWLCPCCGSFKRRNRKYYGLHSSLRITLSSWLCECWRKTK